MPWRSASIPHTGVLEGLEGQRAAAAIPTAGAGRLPDGAAYYAASLKQMTTTDYTPEQVHALGLSEVAGASARKWTLCSSHRA